MCLQKGVPLLNICVNRTKVHYQNLREHCFSQTCHLIGPQYFIIGNEFQRNIKYSAFLSILKIEPEALTVLITYQEGAHLVLV